MKTIFVSSTFRDFQSERDALHNLVLPRLKEQARTYGESVDFCDLRWGVDTSDAADEEESSSKVLTVCMNEIDRSRPHMLVLLGERYGFMPGSEAICHEMDRKRVELEDLEISVTALEIEYGALRNPESLSNTWFYFRNLTAQEDDLPMEYCPESKMHREKLDALKGRIRKLAGDRVRFYNASYRNGQMEGMDDFVQMVQKDLTGQLAREWQEFEQMHPYQKDAASQWNYLKSKAAAFSAFGSFAEDVKQHIDEQRVTVVIGSTGSGKTTLFSRVCVDMQAVGWNVLPFACGNTTLSTDGYGILKSLVWQLEEMAGTEHIDQKQSDDMERISSPAKDETISTEKESPLEILKNRLDEVSVMAASKGRILIAVDAVDQLAPGEMRDQLKFLPRADFPEIRIFITGLDSFQLPAALRPIQLPRLQEQDRNIVMDSILISMGKELSVRVRDCLIQKKQSDNPLFLYMAVSRLTLMDAEDFKEIRAMGDGMEAINAHQLSLIEELPEDLSDLGVVLVDAVAARVNPAMSDAAELMACARHGLRMEDLQGILKETGAFQTLEFAQFINYMSELFLLRSDGCYDFLHKCLREGLKARAGEEKLRNIHVQIADWMESLPEEDSVRTQELAWHLIRSDQKQRFLEHITDHWSDDLTPTMEAASRALIEQSMADGGSFVKELLSDFSSDRAEVHIHFLVGLITKHMPDLFGESAQELAVERAVLEDALTATKRLAEEQPTELYQKQMYFTERVLGTCCFQQRDKDSLQRALDLFEDSLANEEDGKNSITVYLYLRMAETLLNLGGRERLEQAAVYVRKSIGLLDEVVPFPAPEWVIQSKIYIYALLAEIDENLGTDDAMGESLQLMRQTEEWAKNLLTGRKDNLSKISCKMGRLLRKKRDESSRAEGLIYLEKTVQLMREIVLENNTSVSVSNLATGCMWLGEAYVEESSDEMHASGIGEKGISLLRESIDLFDDLAGKYGSLYVKNLAGFARLKLAAAVEKILGAGENVKILRDARCLAQTLAEDSPTPTFLANYATVTSALICALEKQRKAECDDEAISLALENRNVCEELYRNYHMTELLRAEQDTCYYAGQIFRRAGGRENLGKALEWRKRALELARQIFAERETESAGRELLISMDGVIRTLRDLGDRGYLEEAGALGEEAVRLAEEIAENQNTKKAREDLADIYELCGSVCRNLGDGDSRKEALCWYQKSVREYESLAQESGTEQSAAALERVYRKTGRIGMYMGSEYLADAWVCWKKAYNAAENLYHETGALKYRKSMGVACWGLGVTLENAGGD